MGAVYGKLIGNSNMAFVAIIFGKKIKRSCPWWGVVVGKARSGE
jgi:hypothetical protein